MGEPIHHTIKFTPGNVSDFQQMIADAVLAIAISAVRTDLPEVQRLFAEAAMRQDALNTRTR